MRKAKNMEESKKAMIESLDKNIKEVEDQKEMLSESINLRLKQYATEKNALIEKANKEIEEFNSMYTEFDALCKSMNVSPEKIWVHGRD